jgi:hypothetical protein
MSGFWVLDADVYKPEGKKSFDFLENKYGKLPETRLSKTGNGGFQFFWKYNGTKIGSSNSKIAPAIDIKADGGYVVLPPSNHPSGKKYEWLKKFVDLPTAPIWLIDLIIEKEKEFIKSLSNTSSTYGEKALSNEIIKISSSVVGNRNDLLYDAAKNLSQLISGGELDYGHVYNSLLGMALSVGLEEKESIKTINSGFKAGFKKPRTAPQKDNLSDFDCKPISSDVSQCKQESSNLIQNHDYVSNMKAEVSKDERKLTYGLAFQIEEWVTNSTGSFTVDQIDKEFCLTTRQAKNNRSVCLNRMLRNKLIIKDKRAKGKYHVLDTHVEFINPKDIKEIPFGINLPFDLHKFCSIPQKAIIIFAGSSNAGKTALILNTLKLNLKAEYAKFYLMSEMGAGEYVDRLKCFRDTTLDDWDSVKAAEKSCGFNGIIEHYNKDGLTCVDFLEEIDGEYARMGSQIREIYDALGNGIALIAIQKRSDQEYGRGGEATAEKSRLYAIIDHITTLDDSIICSLKLKKVKRYIGRNLQGHEIHYKIHHGSQIEPITDWMRSSDIDRAKCKIDYERECSEITTKKRFKDEDYLYKFKCVDGVVGLDKNTLDKWVKAYEPVDVAFECQKLSDWSYKMPQWTKKDWIFRITNILSNTKQGRFHNYQDGENG